MNELQQLSDALDPLIKKADAQGEIEKQNVEDQLKTAESNARVSLRELSFHLPALPTQPAAAQRYVAEKLEALGNRLQAPPKPDLSTEELVAQNELLKGLNLHIHGAHIAYGSAIKLLPGRNPFKNPRDVKFKLEDKDVRS